MTTTQLTDQIAPATIAEKFEVVTLPVADVDRAKAFYLSLGWRLDIDFEPLPGVRGVQFTPPGSPTSIQFGSGSTTMTEPHQGLLLVVDDIEAARDDLVSRGVDVGEIWHLEPGKGPVPGRDPERRSYFTRAVVRGPGRQPVAAPGGRRAAARPRRAHRPRPAGRAAGRDGAAPRRLRGRRRAAQLVGLVRGLPRRAPGRRHPRAGRHGRRRVHEGGIRRDRVPLSAALIRRTRGPRRRRGPLHVIRAIAAPVGQRRAELPARADAELAEHLAQVPLDGARAEEQLRADLRVRLPVRRHAARSAAPAA